MTDGMIPVDSVDAKKIGFTSDKFVRESYLWKEGNKIMVSFIESRVQRNGNFEGLCDAIHELGFMVAVPTPSNMMRNFLNKHKFKQTYESNDGDSVEVWVK